MWREKKKHTHNYRLYIRCLFDDRIKLRKHLLRLLSVICTELAAFRQCMARFILTQVRGKVGPLICGCFLFLDGCL